MWSTNSCWGEGRCMGCRNMSLCPHLVFLVLPPAVPPVQGGRCQGSSWGRENQLSSCCSEAFRQCGKTAAKQPPYKQELLAEAPRLQPFMYFMEDLLVNKEPWSQRAPSAFLIWAVCMSPPLLLDHLRWKSHGGIFSWKFTCKSSSMESSSLPWFIMENT